MTDNRNISQQTSPKNANSLFAAECYGLSAKFTWAIHNGNIEEVKTIHSVTEYLNATESLFHEDISDPVVIAHESGQLAIADFLVENKVTKLSKSQLKQLNDKRYGR